jgi:glycosyltransferase involved in cell wall biosynthesis
MKILVVQDYLRSGGTERQSILLTRAFAREGHHARLLTFRPGGVLAAHASDLPWFSLQPFDTGLDWFAPDLKRAARRFDPDVILCMGRMANCRALALQRAARRAVVLCTLRTGKPLPWLFRRALRRVPHVVANSDDARQTLQRHHAVPAERITVIHNSLVFAGTRPPEADVAALRAAHGASPATHVLVSVAMFRPEKRQRDLIATLAGLPSDLDWQLWLAGEGPTLTACRRFVSSRGLGERVKFLGWQANPAPLYAAADLAVHASASEALSNFLIEAQFNGIPAVAYDAQGIAECFLPGDTGEVIARGDAAAFRAAVLRFLEANADERAVRAGRARDFARDRFDPIRQARAYLELFSRLTGPTPP